MQGRDVAISRDSVGAAGEAWASAVQAVGAGRVVDGSKALTEVAATLKAPVHGVSPHLLRTAASHDQLACHLRRQWSQPPTHSHGADEYDSTDVVTRLYELRSRAAGAAGVAAGLPRDAGFAARIVAHASLTAALAAWQRGGTSTDVDPLTTALQRVANSAGSVRAAVLAATASCPRRCLGGRSGSTSCEAVRRGAAAAPAGDVAEGGALDAGAAWAMAHDLSLALRELAACRHSTSHGQARCMCGALLGTVLQLAWLGALAAAASRMLPQARSLLAACMEAGGGATAASQGRPASKCACGLCRAVDHALVSPPRCGVETSVSTVSTAAVTKLALAAVACYERDLRSAAVLADEARALAPDWAPAAWLLGLIHAHGARPRDAGARVTLPECGSAVAQSLLLGCSQRGASASAAAACSLALGVAWATPQAHGDAGASVESLRQATQCFGAAVSKSSAIPSHAQCCALYNSALVLHKLGEADAATSTLEALSRESLQHPECGVPVESVAWALAQLYVDRGRWPAAARLLQAVASGGLTPHAPPTMRNGTLVLVGDASWEQPCTVTVLRMLALALLKDGKAAAALEACDRALARVPHDVVVLGYKGDALRCLGRHEDALAVLSHLASVLDMWYGVVCVGPGAKRAAPSPSPTHRDSHKRQRSERRTPQPVSGHSDDGLRSNAQEAGRLDVEALEREFALPCNSGMRDAVHVAELFVTCTANQAALRAELTGSYEGVVPALRRCLRVCIEAGVDDAVRVTVAYNLAVGLLQANKPLDAAATWFPVRGIPMTGPLKEYTQRLRDCRWLLANLPSESAQPPGRCDDQAGAMAADASCDWQHAVLDHATLDAWATFLRRHAPQHGADSGQPAGAPATARRLGRGGGGAPGVLVAISAVESILG